MGVADGVEGNLALSNAIERAKAVNMPKLAVERAIEKGSKAGSGAGYEELVYEVGDAYLTKSLHVHQKGYSLLVAAFSYLLLDNDYRAQDPMGRR